KGKTLHLFFSPLFSCCTLRFFLPETSIFFPTIVSLLPFLFELQDFLALRNLECIIFTLIIIIIHLGCLLIISVCIHAHRSSIA
ncbi:CCA-adding enzyme, partial [Bienertia sinuspersici]